MGKKTFTPEDLHNLFKENNLPSQFCIVPFTNLIFNPNGDIGVCRQKGTEHVVGNLLKESIEDVWNSDYLVKWREEFLTGNIEVCKKEVATDFCHLSPDNYTLFPEIDLTSHQEKSFLKLTANFNGKCNLKCTMCEIWMMENGLYDRIGFWERAESEFFPYIKEIEMLSGEPFIQKDTYRLIEMISESNPDVLWSITTNGYWKFNETIEKYLDKIKVKNIIFSIDSLIPERYAEIRRGGHLDQVLGTLKKMQRYNRKRVERGDSSLNLTVHYLVMKNNWEELPELANFIRDNELRLTVNNCYEPKDQSLWDYSHEEEFKIGEKIIDNCDDDQLKMIMRSVLAIVEDLPPIYKATLLEKIHSRFKGNS